MITTEITLAEGTEPVLLLIRGSSVMAAIHGEKEWEFQGDMTLAKQFVNYVNAEIKNDNVSIDELFLRELRNYMKSFAATESTTMESIGDWFHS